MSCNNIYLKSVYDNSEMQTFEMHIIPEIDSVDISNCVAQCNWNIHQSWKLSLRKKEFSSPHFVSDFAVQN